MGHIELAVPVLHPWIRALDPNPLCAFLGLDRNGLDEVVYCRKHVVVDPKGSDLRRGQLLDEAQYRAAREKFGYECQARMGAEAVAKLAQGADFGRAKEELLKAADPERRSEAVEAAALLESLRRTTGGALPGILEAIPVLPAGLRPSVRLGGAQTATSDLNELYERVVRRNNRLKALAAMKTPGIMLRDEQRLLQEAVDALFGNGYRGHSLRASREVALTALSDRLKGPKGRFIQCLAGKRVDYSARSVIAPGTFLRLDECAVPKELALELFRPFVVGELLRTQAARSRRQAERLVDRCRSEAYRALKAVIRDKVVLLVRAPSLHKYNVLAFRPVLTSERVIRIHPNVTIGFNADYDGDQMTLHVPLSEAAQEEARRLLMASGNLFGTASSAMMNRPSQEIILGCTTMTLERRGARGEGRTFTTGLAARNAWKAGEIEAQARIRVRLDAGETETTAGRILFNEILPDELEFANEPVGGAQLQRLIAECYVRCGVGRTAELVDAVKEFGFHFATVSGVSIWRTEPCSAREAFFAAMDAERAALRRAQEAGEIDGKGRYLRTIDLWSSAQARLREQVLEELARLDDGFFPISMMVRSGARGSQQQMLSLFGACGLSSDMFGRIVEFPVRECMMTGMGAMSYFLRANGARAGLAMTALRIAPAGDLMRRIVEALEDVMVVAEDCGTTRGLEMSASAPEGRISPALAERAAGRILAQEVRSSDGTVLFGAGQELSEAMARRMEESGVRTVSVRSPMTCEARGGVCARCYGHDLGRKRLVEVGAAAGITAAVSLGEPLTQLTMRSFHLGHGYPYSWIAQGRPEQDIKYSSGFPRLEEVFEMLEKRRAFGPALDGVDERPSAQSVLDRQGEEAAQQYLLRELMHVYAESGVRLNSKHYEIAVRQLMSFVEVEEPGDTGLATGQRVQRDDLAAASEAVKQWGGRPATAKPILLPITEVALRAGSFLAASASWQTVKVLTKAALRRDTDRLKGMRENIILGRLIRPAGAPRG
jgi:DNA-directed RNA polymerase subunit beta'